MSFPLLSYGWIYVFIKSCCSYICQRYFVESMPQFHYSFPGSDFAGGSRGAIAIGLIIIVDDHLVPAKKHFEYTTFVMVFITNFVFVSVQSARLVSKSNFVILFCLCFPRCFDSTVGLGFAHTKKCCHWRKQCLSFLFRQGAFHLFGVIVSDVTFRWHNGCRCRSWIIPWKV